MAVKIWLNVTIRIVISLFAMGAYFAAAMTLFPLLGQTALATAFIPPAIAGWLLGVRGGVLSGILSIPLTIFLLNSMGDARSAHNPAAAVVGGLLVMLIGAAIGWIRGLLDRLKKQAAELQNERVLLEEEVRRRTEAEERLIHEALHDPLTDLPNRRLFIDRIEHAVAWGQRNPRNSSALLYLDLDRFKSINDNLGHEAGDQFLIQAAGRLKSSLRTVDTVARMGGDEFAVLLEAVSEPEEVLAIARRIQASLALPYEWNGKPIATGASIGIVVNLAAYEQIDDIMRDADVAMYRAKAAGGNQHRVFTDGMRGQDEEQRRAADRRSAEHPGPSKEVVEPLTQ